MAGDPLNADSIPGLRRVHCSYHKCLTVYFRKVFERAGGPRLRRAPTYRHFSSRLDEFYAGVRELTIASVNNHAIDLDRFEDVRVTRLIRDPRDLVVSGYFHHKRAAEIWCSVVDPDEESWRVVNGDVPAGLPPGRSFADHLNDLPLEAGLAAEIEFRKKHFESMLEWPEEDSRVRVFRYEDILGNEASVVAEMLRFYELPLLNRGLSIYAANRLKASRRIGRTRHIRDPRVGQWREIFTPALKKRFATEYGALLVRLGYPVD